MQIHNCFEEMYEEFMESQLPGCGVLTQSSGFSEEAGTLGSDLQQQLNFDMEQEYHRHVIPDVLQTNTNNTHSWETNLQQSTLLQEDEQNHNDNQEEIEDLPDQSQQISAFVSGACVSSYPELTSWLPNSTISFASRKPMELLCEVGESNMKFQDPQISFSAQAPCLADIYQTLSQCSFQMNPSKGSFLGLDDREGGFQTEIDQTGQFANSILVDVKCDISKGDVRGHANHFQTEKQRREYLNEKYQNLRTLVPNPTKADRASIVGDAIEYIKELLRTVEELKLLVEQKRSCMGRNKRHKPNQEQETESPQSSSPHDSFNASSANAGGDDRSKFKSNGALRSSWLQRTSKDGTQVDVKIVDNEVTIQLIQRKCRSCLLSVSSVLEELHLEILHVNGANIGEYYTFLFNTKIYEGSYQYARSIATKLMEAVGRHVRACSMSSAF